MLAEQLCSFFMICWREAVELYLPPFCDLWFCVMVFVVFKVAKSIGLLLMER